MDKHGDNINLAVRKRLDGGTTKQGNQILFFALMFPRSKEFLQ